MTLGILMLAGGVIMLAASIVTAILFWAFPLKYDPK